MASKQNGHNSGQPPLQPVKSTASNQSDQSADHIDSLKPAPPLKEEKESEKGLPNPPGINRLPEQDGGGELPPRLYNVNGWIVDTSKKLGKGAYGAVYECRSRLPGVSQEVRACKVIHIVDGNRDWAENCLKAEIRVHRRLAGEKRDHKDRHIVTLYDHLKTRNWGIMILDYAACGSIESYVNKYADDHQGALVPLERVRRWIKQMTLAVYVINKKGYAHRDIKLENFLLKNEDHVLITDFGMSTKCVQHHMESVPVQKEDPPLLRAVDRPKDGKPAYDLYYARNTYCGTLEYRAPEVSRPPYDPLAADCFSLGMCFFKLTNGRFPYLMNRMPPKGEKDLEECKQKGNVQFSKIFMVGQPLEEVEKAKKLIGGMLKPNSKERPTISQVRDDDWVKNSPA